MTACGDTSPSTGSTRGTCRRPEPARAALRLDVRESPPNESRRSGSFLLGPELSAFEAEFADWPGAPHCVGVSSGAGALQLALAAAGSRPRRRGDRARVHRGAHRVGGLPRRRDPGAVDVDPRHGVHLDRRASRAAERPRTKAVIVVHLYGCPASCPTPTCRSSRTPPRPTARCDDPARSAATAYSFYPTKNLGGIGDGGAVVTDDPRDRRSRAPLRVHGMTEQYVHAVVSQNFRMSEIEAAWLRLALPSSPPTSAGAGRSSPRYRGPPPGCAGRADHPRHAYHLAVFRSADRARRRVPRCRRARRGTAVHYPLALTQQPAYRELDARAVPRGRGVGGRVHQRAVLPGDDRRRGRPGVRRAGRRCASMTARRQRVGGVPLLQRRDRRSAAWSTTCTRRSRRSVAEVEVIVVNDGSADGSRARARRARRRSALAAGRSTTRRNGGYGKALISGFTAARNEWIFYTDGDAQYDATRGGAARAAGHRRRSTSCRATRSAAATPWYRKVIGRMLPPRRQAAVQPERARHRLRLPPVPPSAVRRPTADVDQRRDLRRDDAHRSSVPGHASSRFRCTTTSGPYGKSQFFRLPAIARSARQLLDAVVARW